MRTVNPVSSNHPQQSLRFFRCWLHEPRATAAAGTAAAAAATWRRWVSWGLARIRTRPRPTPTPAPRGGPPCPGVSAAALAAAPAVCPPPQPPPPRTTRLDTPPGAPRPPLRPAPAPPRLTPPQCLSSTGEFVVCVCVCVCVCCVSVCVHSSFMVLYVHRNHKAYQGRGSEDGHLDFLSAPELCGVCIVG